jgi:4-amino-4-deoxy-L-arabinose transferase-like glycosyltransferase
MNATTSIAEYVDKTALSHAIVVACCATLVAMFFCFQIYPRIQQTAHAVLDPDGFGLLGQGLRYHASLSYFPDREPTVNRGPLYPAFIASALLVSGGKYPQAVQAAQAVLFGLTCGGVVLLTALLGNRRAGLLAGMLAVFHPFLIWYTSRVWVETLATFWSTAIAVNSLVWARRPTLMGAFVLGITIGLATLTKGLFLIFVLSVPLLLRFWDPQRRQGGRHGLVVALVSLCVITPWTFRNFKLTGRFIPVHVNAGFATLLGNTFVDHFRSTGFHLAELHRQGALVIERYLTTAHLQLSVPRWKREVEEDTICETLARLRWKQEPTFFLRKCLLNACLFWTLGDTPLKSVVVSAFQLPLALLFAVASLGLIRKHGARDVRVAPVILTCLYYAVHWPVIACARYSVVVTPVMIATIFAFAFRARQPNPQRRHAAQPTPST